MSCWYAVRTAPGSQSPKRRYTLEPTSLGKDGRPKGKGYRIVPSLDPNKSAVELALDERGISHYMPAEFRAIRLRRQTHTYTVRRFPMMPGYVFVHGVSDWMSLHETPGVIGVVGLYGEPAKIIGDNSEIIRLMAKEGISRLEAVDQIEKWQNQEVRERNKAQVKAIKVAKRRISTGSRVRIMWGPHVGKDAEIQAWEADGMVKALIEDMDGMETIQIAHDMVDKIPRAA